MTCRESLGELEKAVETLAYGSCSYGIPRSLSRSSTRVSIKQLDYELKISTSSSTITHRNRERII